MTPRSAVDVIGLAFDRTRRQLLPFRWGQWWRLAVLGLATGELGSNGSCGRYNLGSGPSMPSPGAMFDPSGVTSSWYLDHIGLIVASLIGGVTLLFLISLLFLYLGSVCRFVLLDTIVQGECRGIRAGWRQWRATGRRFFAWLIVFQLVLFFWFLLLVGVPLLGVWLAGWFSPPAAHIGPLIAIGVVVLLACVASALGFACAYVLAKDFMAPMMAVEPLGASEAWRRLREVVRADRMGVVVYLLMKIVLAIVAGLAMLALIVVVIIPIVFAGVAIVFGANRAGLTWNIATIAAAGAAAVIAVSALVVIFTLASVPLAVFFPSYALYFVASRVPAVEAWLHPPLEPEPGPIVEPPRSPA